MVHLREMKAGECGEIEGFEVSGDNNYKKKLLALGLTKGTRLKVLRVAPLGDPVEVEVRGTMLSLRKGESDLIKIRRV